MPRLVIMKGVGVGRDYAVGTECVVGRATEADFVIEDLGASRRHFRVSRDGDGYVVEDLGARNGTFLNGARVQREGLRDGDLLRAGGTEMAFRQKDMLEAASPPAAQAVPKAAVAPAGPKPGAPPAARPATPAAPAAPSDTSAPARKPLPSVVPTRRRGVF